MNRVQRTARAEIERLGARIIATVEAGRHTELYIEIDGRNGLVRLHRGNKVSFRTEKRTVRAAVRRVARGTTP